MKVRTRILILIVIVAAILVGVRIRTISNSQLKSEAAETRLTLEAMAQQDTSSIQEEIELKRTVTDADADEETTTVDGEVEAEEDSSGMDPVAEDHAVVERSGDEIVFSDTEMPPLDSLKEVNYKELFSNCVVMGDSIASGLDSYDILTSTEAVTKIGSLTFEATRDQLPTAAAINPKILFVAYGLNDTITFGDDVENFKETYEDFLTTAQELMPNTTIYSILILPVQEKALESHPGFKYIDTYNQAIIEACEDHGVSYMNLGFTALEPYFDTDGLHMYPDFYYGWAYYMAKGAGLIK